MCRDGKGQADIHPAREALDRRIQKFVDLRKGDDFIKLGFDFPAAHAEDCAI